MTKGWWSGWGKPKSDADAEDGSKGAPDHVDYVEDPEKSSDFPFNACTYGIRSYVHQFYERRPPSDDENDGLFGDEKRHKGVCGCSLLNICRFGIGFGLVVLMLGVIAITVGYTFPATQPIGRVVEKVTSGQGENTVVKSVVTFVTLDLNRMETLTWLRYLKMIGLLMIAIGGMVLTGALMVPVCCPRIWAVEQRDCNFSGTGKASCFPSRCTGETSAPAQCRAVYPKISESVDSSDLPAGLTKIPVVKEVREVQPKAGGGGKGSERYEDENEYNDAMQGVTEANDNLIVFGKE